MTLSWTDFKQFITSREDAIIMIETSSQYILIADNFRSIQCTLDRNPSDTTDLDDFETNYESLCNQKPIAKEIIPTAPKNEFDLSIFDMGHKHIDSSAQIFDITLSLKSGVQYNYSCAQTPAYYDCLMQNHSEIRDGVASEESGVITTFYGNLAEGAATLAKPVDIDVPVKMLNNSDPFYYLWGVYVTAADYGEDDLVRLQVIDKDGIGVELGWYTQEQFEAMGSLYVIKEYDECWIGQLEKLAKVLTPDGSPGQLPNGVYLRAKYYPKDITKTNIRFWFDPIISVKS
jgi:hypothetical protein